MVVRISTELGSLIPGGAGFFLPMAELGQSMSDGAFAVLLPRAVVPHAKVGVSLAAGISVLIISALFFAFAFSTNYYSGVGYATVVWQGTLMITTVVAAAVAVLYAYVKASPNMSAHG